MVSAQPRLRLPSRSRLAGAAAVAGSLTALAVPTVQGFLLWRTARPDVPGPHPQDGLVIGGVHDRDPVPLVWLGDSLASGVGAGTPDAAFPRKAAALWCEADGHSVDLVCLARPGAQVADVLADQVPDALARLGPGAVAVVTVGANDVGCRLPGGFGRDYAAVLDALVATGAEVIAVGLPHIGSAAVLRRPLRTIAGVVGNLADRHVRHLAEAHGAHYVHIAVKAPWRTRPHEYLAADKWHPNDATYRLWADRVVARLSPLLAAQAG